ncbi:MAG: mechanosensitive ion channel family protein [Proteobacteria bacterium]|nr:mechanosensitive ion channel family protein [Pseudomonadota bacterium]
MEKLFPMDWAPPWLADWLADWLPVLLAAVLALLLAEVVFRLGQRLLQRASAGTPTAALLLAGIRRPAHLLVPAAALALMLNGAPDDLRGLTSAHRVVGMVLIGSVTWLLVNAVNAFAAAVAARHPVAVADNLQARRIHTQTRVLARVVVGLITLVGTALMLMVLPGVRQLGASLLASAGLAGLVAGFAARPVLGNLIAGLQIGLSQPIRLDDVVVVEGEWGVIEEITGAYVVVRIWDQRRLVVPLQYWVEKPFQNWTRSSSELIGSVFFWVDYRMPLEPLRQALREACESSPDWDRRFCILQVTEAGEQAVQLRALVTAASGPKAWDLRCHVRERLLDFMQREHPQHLPRRRAELSSPAGAPRDDAGAGAPGARHQLLAAG